MFHVCCGWGSAQHWGHLFPHSPPSLGLGLHPSEPPPQVGLGCEAAQGRNEKLPSVSWEVGLGLPSSDGQALPSHGRAEGTGSPWTDGRQRTGGKRPWHPLEMQIKISSSCELAPLFPRAPREYCLPLQFRLGNLELTWHLLQYRWDCGQECTARRQSPSQRVH